MNKRNCLVCNAPIIGRSDKKYCSDQCRASRHNANRSRTEDFISDLNKSLRKNRTILNSLSPEGRSVVEMTILTNLGFKFGYFTSIYVTEHRQVFYLSYDYGFTPIYENGHKKVLIVKAEPFMVSPDPWKYIRK